MTDLVEVANELRRESVLKVLKEVTDDVASATGSVDDVLVMIKIDGTYLRYSSKLEDTMGLVSFLELMKHDVLRRMSS